MSTFLNRLSQSATTRVEVDTAFVGTAVFHDGLAYGASNKLVVNYAGTPAFYMAGIGFTAAGELCVVDASAGLPADTIHQSGLPISRAQSRLCVDPTGAVVYWHNGVPFTAVRAVAVDGAAVSPPGAFAFTAFQLGENVVITWDASADATSYQIKRNTILIHTEPVPGNLFYTQLATIGGSYTMFAINAGGTTASSSNPVVV